MKHRLCVLLILMQGPVVAGRVPQAEFPKGHVDSGPNSPFEAMPEPSPPAAGGEAKPSLSGNVGIFTTDVVFPAPSRPAAMPTPAGGALSRAIVQEFSYSMGGNAVSSMTPRPSEGSVTMLEPISVLGSRERETAEGIDAMERLMKAEAFHPVSGGRLASFSMGRINIELGLWKHQSLISEAPHVGIQRLVIDLVRVRW